MAEDPPSRVDHNQVAEIVSSYLRHHQVEPDQLAGLIVEVHRALADLGRAPSAQQPLQPAVPIRRSLRQDYIVCLECGFRTQVLRRHLRVARGLDIADYRARWKLPLDYPLTASSYSARRSMMGEARSVSGANRGPWWRAGRPTVDAAGGTPRPKDSAPPGCAKL